MTQTDERPNQPAPGNAGWSPWFQIRHPWPGVPEPERWADFSCYAATTAARILAIFVLASNCFGQQNTNNLVKRIPEQQVGVEQLTPNLLRAAFNGETSLVITGKAGRVTVDAFPEFRTETNDLVIEMFLHDQLWVYGEVLGSRSPPMPFVPKRALSEDCEIHGKIRTNGTASVAYGLPAKLPSQRYSDAEQSLFPHAWLRLEEGCVRDVGSPRTVGVRYCPQCRDAEKSWRLTNE